MNCQLNFYSPSTCMMMEKVEYQPAIFRYTPQTKCITLCVYQKNYDQNRSQLLSFQNSNEISEDEQLLKELQFKKHLLLDKSLNIVQKTQKINEIISYQKQYDQVLQNILKQSVVYWDMPKLQANFQIGFKKYMSYKNCNDFHVGRYLFTRKHNSFDIKSELVSRDHCRIIYQQGFCNRQNSKTKNIIQEKCSKFSLLNQLSNELWVKIQQFLFKKDQYYILDTGSRNGTFVKKLKNKEKIRLKHNFSYEFEHTDNYEYYFKVWRIKQNENNQSIQQHNSRFFFMFKQFKQNQLYIEYQKISKTIISSAYVEQNLQKGYFQQDCLNLSNWKQIEYFKLHKINLVIILLQYFNDYKQFFCLICHQNQNHHFDIGIHYQIDTSRNLFFDQNYFHGRIYHQKGKWSVIDAEGLKDKQIKIWTKIPSTDVYKLDLRENYVIRLAHSYYISLRFLNFCSQTKSNY